MVITWKFLSNTEQTVCLVTYSPYQHPILSDRFFFVHLNKHWNRNSKTEDSGSQVELAKGCVTFSVLNLKRKTWLGYIFILIKFEFSTELIFIYLWKVVFVDVLSFSFGEYYLNLPNLQKSTRIKWIFKQTNKNKILFLRVWNMKGQLSSEGKKN